MRRGGGRPGQMQPRWQASPAAAAFFDSLVQFYREAYLRWKFLYTP